MQMVFLTAFAGGFDDDIAAGRQADRAAAGNGAAANGQVATTGDTVLAI